jgi:hypothetical protein
MQTEDKPDLADVEFVIVSPTYKVSLSSYENTAPVKALLVGEAILVPFNTSLSRMYRFAKSKNYKFHKRKTPEGLVLWMDKVVTQEDT